MHSLLRYTQAKDPDGVLRWFELMKQEGYEPTKATFDSAIEVYSYT